MSYENRMMDGESEGVPVSPYGVCSCGEDLRYAEELQTANGTEKDVLYCPNPSAHGGQVKFQKAKR